MQSTIDAFEKQHSVPQIYIMLGKQELMYEGTDKKWYKKDW